MDRVRVTAGVGGILAVSAILAVAQLASSLPFVLAA
jgi:hypothetical protein